MSVFRDLKLVRPVIDACEKDIITIYEKPTIKYPNEKNKDVFYLENEVAEKGRVNRQKYIDSFSKDVGILNVAKKLIDEGASVFDGRFAVKDKSYMDLRGMPKDGEQLNALMAKKDEVWNKLDPELKKSLTYEDFVKSFTGDEFTKYITSKLEATKKVPTEPKKEGE